MQTSVKMMQIKRKLTEGMAMINNSTEEIPLKFVLEGVTVELAMPSVDSISTMAEEETISTMAEDETTSTTVEDETNSSCHNENI